MADVSAELKDWSIIPSSNQPADATTIGAGMADNFQQIQATVRAAFAHKGSDLNSAATIDLGANTGFYHDIVGATGPITSFGTVGAGVWKILQFDSTPTITHNATSMILPGGASITMTAGSHLMAMSLGGGNWVVPWAIGGSGININDASIAVLLTGTGSVATTQHEVNERLQINANIHFGVLGDDSTDNATALYAMRDLCRTITRPITITFDSGTYRYSKNQWVKGINDLTLNCEGSIFKCTSSSSSSFDQYPFVGNQGIFNNSGYTTYNSLSTLFGYKFGSVDAGGSTVTTSTAADAGNFAVGNKVLIYGYGQQDASFPPNPRYFEYNEVVTAVAGTGVITLKNPLKNTYLSTWHDFSQGKGAPRIQNISRDSTDFTFCKRLVVNGGYWAPNPNDTSEKVFQCEGYEQVVLNGVKADRFVPSICRTFELINCDFAEVEFDKIISSIVVRGGRLKEVSAATGVEMLEFRENVLIQGFVELHPRVLIVDGAIFDCRGAVSSEFVLGLLAQGYTMDLADFRSARFNVKDSGVFALVNGGVETTFTVDSVSSNTKVLVVCANEAAFETLYQRLQEGYTYRLQTGLKQVKISKIYDADATHAAIEGEFSDIPVGAEVYRGANLQRINGLANVTQVGPYAPVRELAFARNEWNGIGDIHGGTLRYNELDITRQTSASAANGPDIMIRSRVTRIVVNVNKVYSGTDGTCEIVLSKQLPAAATNYAVINALTLGTREILHSTTTGAVAGDTLTATGGVYIDTMELTLRKDGGGLYPTYTDPVQLPKFSIWIEAMKP